MKKREIKPVKSTAVVSTITEKEKSKMRLDISGANLSTVYYKKFPNNLVIILGFSNFLTEAGLRRKYGDTVADVYLASLFCIKKKFYESGEAFLVSGEDEIYEGQVLTTKEFGKLIAFIRKCGENLQKIVKINNDDEVRSVTI